VRSFRWSRGCSPRAGRAWKVNHIDWLRHFAYVEPTDAKGQSRWKGWTRSLDYPLCQSIKQVLINQDSSQRWSRRATEQIEVIRHEFAWLEPDSTVVLMGSGGELEWWTFGGMRANATLAAAMAEASSSRVEHDDFGMTFESRISLDNVQQAIQTIRWHDIALLRPLVNEDAIGGLKFSQCLPKHLAIEMLEKRLADPDSTRRILEQKIRFVTSVGQQ
jgi:ATP-dependent Lhr-like helicase